MSRRKVRPAEAEKIAGLLHRFMRHLTKGHHDDVVRELPLAQLRLCSALCSGPRSMSVLSCELGVSRSAMTQIADRLEHARFVRRVSQEGDRRVRCLELTERGQRMMRLHEKTRVMRMGKVLAHLTAKERQSVTNVLTLMIRASALASGEDGDAIPNDFHPITSRMLL